MPETSDEIIQSVKTAIIYDKDVCAIKDSIVTYLEAQSVVSKESSQIFLESFKQLVQKLVQIQKSLQQDTTPLMVDQDVKPSTEVLGNIRENFDEKKPLTDDRHIVQIHADRKEIYRRISSFVTRKRKEVDEWNMQEFCSHHPVEEENPLWDEINSCARVDAVFIPRTGSKSHVKVSKVHNALGPQQIHLQSIAPFSTKTEMAAPCGFSRFESDSIEERIRNMESHLKLKSDSTARNNVYARLKQLEDRILFLESSSPEYLNFLGTKIGSPEKPNKTEEPALYTSNTTRLYKRLQTLREELKWKSRKLASESPS